jgi:hypothetical protein
MSSGPSDFKISNVRRAIAGAEKAGIEIGRIEVKTDGTVAIIPQGKEKPAAGNDWDQAIDQLAAKVR